MQEMTAEEFSRVDEAMEQLANGVVGLLPVLGPATKESLVNSGLDDAQDDEAALFGFIMQETNRYGMKQFDASTLALTILWVQRKIRQQLTN